MSNTSDPEKGTPRPSTSTLLITFTTPLDAENPQDWPLPRKWAVTGVLSATGFNRIMVSTIMAPALPIIARELHMSYIESVMAMSVYLLATAVGPLFIGPLSEVYGRSPVLHVTNIWFLVWNLVCGFADSTGVLITARLMAGFGASAIYALGSGVLGDVWSAEQRGRSLGLYLLIPLLGAAVGPILGGIIVQYTTWRWMFWSTSILQAVMILGSFLFFPETHAPTILRKRAKHVRETTSNPQYQTAEEILERNNSRFWTLQNSLTRPLRLLSHPIIQLVAILSALNYGVLYLLLSSFSTLYTTKYAESPFISTLHYLSVSLGEILGALIAGPPIDAIYRHLKHTHHGVSHPEFRAPALLPGTLLAPAGLLMYGWAAQYHTHWIVVDVGATILAFGMQITGQAAQAYLIDAYPDHTGSAAAAAQVLRSLAAFGFPLFAPALYRGLGYGGGNSVLAGVVGVVGVLVTAGIWWGGGWARGRGGGSY
jgi:multidrug resistance protein